MEFKKEGFSNLLRFQITNQPTVDDSSEINSSINSPLYNWGGRFRLVPAEFEIPTQIGYPPFRRLQPADIFNFNQKKRLNDFRFPILSTD